MSQLPPQAWLEAESVARLFAAFEDADQELRFVGGCVRNALLGRQVHDLDAATTATPEQMQALLNQAGFRCIPTGIDHGTITALLDDARAVQITTLRSDIRCDGRHAEVQFGTDWREDALRRDFTMNALYCDAQGVLSDPADCGGIADALAGRVRFMGDAQTRIREDALRLLRFFRFLATHGTQPADAASLTACAQHAALLHDLSGERIWQEMHKLLAAPDPYTSLALMQHAGVLDALRLPPQHNMLQTYLQEPLLRLCLLLPLGDAARAASIAQRWRLSNAHKDMLHCLVSEPNLSLPQREIDFIHQLRHLPPDARRLMLARNAAIAGLSISETDALLVRLETITMPVFPLNGADLIRLGIPQGAKIGELLAQCEAEWQQSDYTLSREALLEHEKKLMDK
jgi:poly(A) polymerase